MMEKLEGCPGFRMMDFKSTDENMAEPTIGKMNSQLTQWPIQMHLINPTAPYYQRAGDRRLPALWHGRLL